MERIDQVAALLGKAEGRLGEAIHQGIGGGEAERCARSVYSVARNIHVAELDGG